MTDFIAWVTLIGSMVAIAAVIVGWIKISHSGVAVRTELDTKTKNDIAQMSEDIKEIKATLGDGYASGLKGTVQEIKNNCGRQVSRIVTLMEIHIASPGHGTVPQNIADLNARVKSLERDREWDGKERRRLKRREG